MDRTLLLVVVLGVCLINGMFSPWLAVIALQPALWFLGFVPTSPQLLVYLSSLMLATLTLLISGVPAALYERWIGLRGEDDNISMYVWLGAAVLLSLQALQRLVATL